MKSAAKSTLFAWLAMIVLIATVPAIGAGSTYGTSANRAVGWLSSHQNSDGSWGATDDLKLPYTVEAVMALRAVSQRSSAYFWGIAWLENHCGPNVDYEARRILALFPHGDNVQTDQTYLQTSQMLTQPGNNGWGLTTDYQGAPLDSAMALLAWSQLGITTNVQVATNYLKSAQLASPDSGWAVAQEAASDPITTSFVLQALTNYKSLDSTLSTSIANGVSALSADVTTSSPTHIQALAALAYVRTGYSSNATTLLNSLSSAQSTDGSWSEDIYATAVCARAMAAAAGTDASALSTPVIIPDQNLRTAINKALGKDSMDTLTEGDLANLISITAENMNISNLTGLQWAVNLTFADFDNNNITSIAPLSGLTNLTTLEWAGNPGYTPPSSTAVPAMSMPVMLLTAFLLIVAGVFSQSRKRKSQITRSLILAFVSLFLAQAAYALDANDPRNSGLDPQTAQKVQAIGRAVLATRHPQPESPAMAALRQKLADLRQAVMEVHPGVVRLSNEARTTVNDGQSSAANEKVDTVRAALEGVRQRRAAVELDIQDNAVERDRAVEQNATAKVRELESEVEDALQSPAENRAEKLRALQDRLAIKSLPPTPPGNVTPTISTIVRHRAN
jgi:hypothetical protein